LKVEGSGFRTQGLGSTSTLADRVLELQLRLSFEFRVPFFWTRLSGSGFQVPGSGVQVSGSACGFRVPGCGFRFSISGFRFSVFGFRFLGYDF